MAQGLCATLRAGSAPGRRLPGRAASARTTGALLGMRVRDRISIFDRRAAGNCGVRAPPAVASVASAHAVLLSACGANAWSDACARAVICASHASGAGRASVAAAQSTMLMP